MLPKISYFNQLKLHKKEISKTSVKFIKENVIYAINIVWDKQPAS
jgi:hypothetical protein